MVLEKNELQFSKPLQYGLILYNLEFYGE